MLKLVGQHSSHMPRKHIIMPLGLLFSRQVRIMKGRAITTFRKIYTFPKDSPLVGAVARRRLLARRFASSNQRIPQKPEAPRVQAIRECRDDWQRALVLLRESEMPTLEEFNMTIDACARALKPSEAYGLVSDLKDINLASDVLPVERVLGVLWCLE